MSVHFTLGLPLLGGRGVCNQKRLLVIVLGCFNEKDIVPVSVFWE